MANWYDSIPVPVDANGHEVPLGTKELVFDGERREVYCFIYNIGRGCWNVGFKRSCGAALSACTLPDSWERLEKDAKKDACEYFVGYGDGSVYNKCQSCPAYGDNCGPAMAQDIVRRAKALAGVAEGE